MARFEALHAEFLRADIAIHAITAEPGDVRQAMLARGLSLSFPVISDPSLSLMHLQPDDGTLEQVYIRAPSYRPQLVLLEQYTMVQPALVVADRVGRIVYWWSWSKLEDRPHTCNMKTAENPGGNTHDVLLRPDCDELLRQLRQRSGSGGAAHSGALDVPIKSLGFPNGRDHDRSIDYYSQETASMDQYKGPSPVLPA